jgi:hypothetical protein
MAKKKSSHPQPSKLEPRPEPENDLWEILDDLSNSICLVTVAKECLGYQEIAGDEYAVLKVAVKHLLDCHKRLDITASLIAPSREEDGQTNADEGGILLRSHPKRTQK